VNDRLGIGMIARSQSTSTVVATDGEVASSREYASTTPASSANGPDLIQAWNASLDAIARELAADLSGQG